MRISRLFFLLNRVCAVTLLTAISALAQTPGASIHGTVTDPAGALIPQADITLTGDKAQARTTQADSAGIYAFDNLPAGRYTITAAANGFAGFRKEGIAVTAGHASVVNISLKIQKLEQQVTVADEALDSNPASNGGAIILKGRSLDALSDNPQDLQLQLQAIAGSDPETGTQFFIDGFSGGKLPPKSSIREIRINQNPYSAQYDTTGFGRVEIFTKPGTDKLHGYFYLSGNDSAFNSRNPFVQQQPPYYSTYAQGNITGPITKHSTFFLDAAREDQQTESFINAITLDPAFQPQTFTQAVSSPTTNTTLNPRFDWQLGKIHTLSLRYTINQSDQTNSLGSQFSLPTQATSTHSTEQILQFSDSQVYGEKLINETRFEYIRDRNNQTSLSRDPTIAVQGAFTGGGNNLGDNRDNQDHYELQNYVSISAGDHFIKFGARYRAVRDANRSTGGFNGQFIFPTITSYQITEQGLANGLTPAQIRAAGGGASQFSINTGNPNIDVFMQDLGVYVEDDWKIHRGMTFSYGLRFETQTGIPDHSDFAPRFGYNWAIGPKNKPPVAVIRAGIGIFYQRFASTYLLNAERQNGINDLQYVVNSPDFYPVIPSPASLNLETSPTTYSISSSLRSPYTVQDGVSVDKSFKTLRVSLNYIHTRGVDLLLTRNINAPLPGTYNPADPSSGVRPFGGTQNLYQYESEGASKRNRLYTNVSLQTKPMTFFGFYMVGRSQANTAGAGTFPSNQYDLHQDYGRASNDIHQRLFFGGFSSLPYHFTLSPFVIYQSSSPFNITIGEDLNGDAQYNDRPAFATDLSRPSVYRTKWGNFDAAPLPGQKIIPINYGTGPSYFTTNLRLGRGFSFGPVVPDTNPAPSPDAKSNARPKKKEIEHRYHLEFDVSAQNIFNYVNPAPPVGVLTSPLFGQSTALGSVFSSATGNRTINLEMGFNF